MMSNNRRDYASSAEWLSALRQDEAWLSQSRQLQNSAASDLSTHREVAKRRIGVGDTLEFWEIYCHQVEPVVREIWEIADLSLPRLKIQAIGMLSMEWLEQQTGAEGVREGSAKGKTATKSKRKCDVQEKSRVTMTFLRKGQVTDGHLTLIFSSLQKENWIDGNQADFLALFSGKMDEDCILTWKGTIGKSTLVELFRRLVETGRIIVPHGFTIPAILEGHFNNIRGEWLTGLGKGDKPNAKGQPLIAWCAKLLKTDPDSLLNGGLDDEEEFGAEYDPYDHQDMQIHKHL